MKTVILLAAIMLGSTACIVRQPAEAKFMTDGKNIKGIKLLMQKVHASEWKIGYRYGVECTSAERANKEELKSAMSASLRIWLKPLRELATEQPIVDKFVYVLQPDFAPADPDGRYNPDLDEDLRQWRDVDLRVTLQCRLGISIARIGLKFQPAIHMRIGTELTPWMLYVIAHEFGHAFGLSDAYKTDSLPSKGGLAATAGNQPASVMALSRQVHDEKIHESSLAITEDDIRGIVWLYNFFHKELAAEDCFFADYVYQEIRGGGGCVPKYPLIFEVKHNDSMHALQILKDDPSIDINAQDASGMTALHYAVLYNKTEVVKALLAHKDIKPLLQNKDGDTPYDIALAAGNGEFLKILPAPPRHKEDVNDDGVVNILDLVAVAGKFGQTNAGNADVNGDGKVDILDLVLVASAFGATDTSAAAPALQTQTNLTATTVTSWLSAAQKLTPQAHYVRGLIQLQQLHAQLSAATTELLTNFPNPFRSETWLPYRLNKAAQVRIQIYSQQGQLVQTLALGHKPAGVYQDKSSAAYWDGRNMQGESVASGVYFYTLSAGNFTATRKMVLRR